MKFKIMKFFLVPLFVFCFSFSSYGVITWLPYQFLSCEGKILKAISAKEFSKISELKLDINKIIVSDSKGRSVPLTAKYLKNFDLFKTMVEDLSADPTDALFYSMMNYYKSVLSFKKKDEQKYLGFAINIIRNYKDKISYQKEQYFDPYDHFYPSEVKIKNLGELVQLLKEDVKKHHDVKMAQLVDELKSATLDLNF